MTDRELMQMALDALLRVWHSDRNIKHSEAIDTIRGRLAQPEPVAVFAFRRKGLDDFCTCSEHRYNELAQKPNLFEVKKFYTSPPQRECQAEGEEHMNNPKQNWPTPSEQYAFERGFQRAREITFELWQWLTDEEIGEIIEASQITLKNYCSEEKQTEFARAIEAKLRRKNEQPCLF